MSLTQRRGRTLTAIAGSVLLVGTLAATPATAAPLAGTGIGHGPGKGPDGLTLERLDRGLVAAATSEGVFLSWRLLASEVTGATATGLTGPDFAVYRDGTLLGTVTDSTNFVDPAGTTASRYRVAAVVERRRGRRRRGDPVGPGEPRHPAAQAGRRRHPGGRGVHVLGQRHVRGGRRRRRPVRVHRQVGPVELEGRQPGRLHRQRLRRRLRAGRHAAVAHRPGREHPRRRALHAVPRLRLRR